MCFAQSARRWTFAAPQARVSAYLPRQRRVRIGRKDSVSCRPAMALAAIDGQQGLHPQAPVIATFGAM